MVKNQEISSGHEEKSLFDQANEEWEAGNLSKAFSLFNAAASGGDLYAFNSIGYFFDCGLGLTPNFDKALFWYKKAARVGDVCAYSNIGLLYLKCGNERQAKFWLAKAISEDDGDAALEMAKIFLRIKSKKNVALAVMYLQAAIRSKSTSEASREEANHLLAEARGATKRTRADA
jgi:TPR repeat protein